MMDAETFKALDVGDLLEVPPLLPACGDKTCLSVVTKDKNALTFRVEYLGVLIGTWGAILNRGRVKWSFDL